MATTTIVNVKTGAYYDQYVGRGTIYGNPYSHLPGTTSPFKVSNRTEAIMKYREWLRNCPGLV